MCKKLVFILLLFCWQVTEAAQTLSQHIQKTNEYIHKTWTTLTRDMTECRTFIDSKIKEKSVLYLPAGFPIPDQIKMLAAKCNTKVVPLPKSITAISATNISKEYASGLLYLPHPYVVPGGMFNEMYGWDSYFIIRGLIASGELTLAKGMVENFFFEIDHYGGILNANRGYYLSRSQPPFLSAMVLSIYEAEKKQGKTNLKWLENAYQYILKDYQLWTNAPHVVGGSNLSRYFDFADGPIAETKEIAHQYYRDAIKYFLLHPEEDKGYITRNVESESVPRYSIKLCNKDEISFLSREILAGDCLSINHIGLTPAYYKSDRAIRESGLDISFRFGAYAAGTTDYLPVDLNSLLYLAEKNMETITSLLGKTTESAEWKLKAKRRAEQMNQLMWNKKSGLFYDYNYVTNTQSKYEYLSSFYPLWVGMASPAQAKALRDNLKLFEQKGGLSASTFQSGAQWDFPYGWAPLELIAIEGLRNYGYNEDADRLTKTFINTIANSFFQDGTIREKYDVVNGTSETRIKVGYPTNEVGFGWTNGVFVTLLQTLNQ